MKYQDILRQAIPALLAISIVEIVNIEVVLSGAITKENSMLFVWMILKLIPTFLFSYISDLHFRKETLIICQLLGIVGGLFLSVFGFESWVLILIAMTFNPIPVARAALLDHFPRYSTVKLVSFTFLAQYIPWALYTYIEKFDYGSVVHFIVVLLALNTILTIFLFKKDPVKNELEVKEKKNTSVMKNKNVMNSLIAFTLAEITFFVFEAYLGYIPDGHSWLSITSFATLIGLGIAVLYTRLPHISIITLFYGIGAGMTAIACFHCFLFKSSCNNNILSSMSFYSVIGGLYLPFVTDAVIRMKGSKHRAFGSALVESADTIASFVAPLLIFLFRYDALVISIFTVLTYVVATVFQWNVEKKVEVLK